MVVLVFYGKEDSYWWVLCVEKVFKEQGTPNTMKLSKAVAKLCGCVFRWWLWWSQCQPPTTWDSLATVFLWHFKPEWREILLIEEEDEPVLDSMKFIKKTSFF
ncbi:unnamed protein product [Lathyrus sativus]|nr:unnamed protein product [Lathyrus sativus]